MPLLRKLRAARVQVKLTQLPQNTAKSLQHIIQQRGRQTEDRELSEGPWYPTLLLCGCRWGSGPPPSRQDSDTGIFHPQTQPVPPGFLCNIQKPRCRLEVTQERTRRDLLPHGRSACLTENEAAEGSTGLPALHTGGHFPGRGLRLVALAGPAVVWELWGSSSRKEGF